MQCFVHEIEMKNQLWWVQICFKGVAIGSRIEVIPGSQETLVRSVCSDVD